MNGVGGAPDAPRAPGERQTPPDGLYSGAMIMPPPYRLASTRAAGFGAAIFEQGDLRLTSGSTLKKTKYCTGFVQFCTDPFPGGIPFGLD